MQANTQTFLFLCKLAPRRRTWLGRRPDVCRGDGQASMHAELDQPLMDRLQTPAPHFSCSDDNETGAGPKQAKTSGSPRGNPQDETNEMPG